MECSNDVTSESIEIPLENNSTDTALAIDTSDGQPEENVVEIEEEAKVQTSQQTQEVFVPSSNELRHGYRILGELMTDSNKSVNWAFMDAVDIEGYGLHDYYERVKHPMWLRKMKEKFELAEYETITQFVADFRRMLENCYRYNGPDHYISKRGQRLETMLEQKLTLLSRELREKTSITATSGKPDGQGISSFGASLRRRNKNITPHDSSALLNQLRQEEARRERESRKQQIQERRAAQEAIVQEVLDWEDKLLEEPTKTQLKHMWELPQIGLFLFLCQEPLNIGEIVQFELERSFAMAKESTTLQAVMTTLLSTPYQRTRLDKKPMMPYKVWEEKLRIRLNQWYKILVEADQDDDKAATKLGLDPYLFIVIGKKNPLLKKKFHELSYYRKIWIVKALCDHCLATQESLRDAIESQPIEEQREYVLGYDAEGNTYMHFPQFCGADLRVYKQAPFPHPKMEPIQLPETPPPSVTTGKRKHNQSAKSSIKKKKRRKGKEKAVVASVTTPRPSRLRQHIKTVLPAEQLDESSSESSSSTEGNTEGEFSSVSVDESSTCSSSYASSSTRFSIRGRRRLNGSMSSKDNTPEPPSFRGKIRKPRDYDSKLSCHSPLSRANLDDKGWSSKDVTPEPMAASEKVKVKDLRLENETSRDSPLLSTQEETSGQSTKDKNKHVNCDSDTVNPNLSLDKKDTIHATEDCAKGDNPSVATPVDNKSSSSGNTSNSMDSLASDSNETQGYGDSLDSLPEAKVGIGDSNCDKMKNKTVFSETEDCSTQIKCEPDEDFHSSPNVTGCHSDTNDSETNKNDKNCTSVTAANSDNQKNNMEMVVSDYKSCGKSINEDCKSDITYRHNSEMDSDIKYSVNGKEDVKSTKSEDGNSISEEEVKTCKSEMDYNLGDSKSTITASAENCVKSEVTDGVDNKDTFSLSLLANMAVANMSVKSDENTNENATSCKAELSDMKVNISKEESVSSKQMKTSEESDRVSKIESQNGQGEITPMEKDESLEDDVVMEEKKECSKKEKSCTEDQKAVTEEPEEEEDEEVTPEIGPFCMVADTVESLRQLTEQFAEPEPVLQTSRSKRGKTPNKPVRKRCVAELYDRLQFLLKELEPWDSKLLQATKRARAKLRKEQQEYIDEEDEKGEVEDVWESEESASEEENSSDEEQVEEENRIVQTPGRIDKKIKKDVQEIDTSSSGRNTPAEEDLSTSSRGRLRKRRVIPNNSEDATKKRKVVKNLEENYSSASHVPNILQRHHSVKSENTMIRTIPMSLLDQLKLPALNADQKTTTTSASMSASQMLLRANLSSKHTLLTNALSSKTTTDKPVLSADAVKEIIGTVPKGAVSHPVIQQLLAQKVPSEAAKAHPYSVQVVRSPTPKQPTPSPALVLGANPNNKAPSTTAVPNTIPLGQVQLAGNKSRKIEIAKPRTTAIQLTVSTPGKGALPPGKVQLYNQNLLNALPPAVIQQLLQNQSLRIQTVSTDKPGSAVPLGSTIILSQASKEGAQTLTLTNAAAAHPLPVAQSVKLPITVANPQVLVAAKTVKPQQNTASSAVSVVNIAQSPDKQDNSQKTKVPTSPNKPKYACHVTVKSLLQDRAKKALELGTDTPKDDTEDSAKEAIVPSAAQVLSLASEVGQQLPGVLEMSKSDLHTQPIVVTVNTAIKGLPQTLKLPSKETLDSAVQAVVTSVKTTLPTAHLKVPAPSTMPSIQRRKNVTRTIQSMKAPIPVVNAASPVTMTSSLSASTGGSIMQGNISQQKNTGMIVSSRPGMLNLGQIPLTTLTASTGTSNHPISPASKPVNAAANITAQAQGAKSSVIVQQNSTLLKVTPQTFMTSQGLVQGFLTPQGLVIPQTALQQGSAAAGKQILVANPQVLQNKLVVPTGVNSNNVPAISPTSQMPGKVVKPTMMLPTVMNQDSLTTQSIASLQRAPICTTLPSVVNTVHKAPLPSASSSKLLLQAVNTVMPKGKLLTPSSSFCVKPNVNSSSPEIISPQNSLMSKMNVKICPRDPKMSGDQILNPVNYKDTPLSPEILQVNHKGDGKQTMVIGTSNSDQVKAHHALVSDPSALKSQSNISVSGPLGPGTSMPGSNPPVSLGKVSEGGLPAAQVLLSLSQGLQNTKTVTPRKDSPGPGQVNLKNKAPMTGNSVESVNQASMLNIAGQTGNAQKLLLLNIGGNLYTSQGIPVTLDNGVLKIAGSVPSQDSRVQQAIGLSSPRQDHPDVKQPVSTVGQQSVVQLSSGVKDNLSDKRQIVHSATAPSVVHSQPGVPAAGLVAQLPGSLPMQQVLVSGVGSKRMLASSQPNPVNNSPVVVKQLLASPTRVIQATAVPQSQTVNISPNRLLTIPSQGNQSIPLVGLNNQQQVITNRGQIIQMMVPQSLASGTALIGNPVAKDSQHQKTVVIGPSGTTINQQGLSIAASPNKQMPANQVKTQLFVPPKNIPGQKLLSPQKISPKAPVAGIQLVGSSQPGQNSPVVFQMVSPGGNVPQAVSPWKPVVSPISNTVINTKQLQQNVVLSQTDRAMNSVNSAVIGQVPSVQMTVSPIAAANSVHAPVSTIVAHQQIGQDMSTAKPT